METEILRKTLMRCLTDTGLRTLPEAWDGKTPFIRAVAKVLKCDGSENYVLVKRSEGEYRVVRDYGYISAIHSVEEYYPYEYLEKSFIPKEVKFEKKETKIAAILKDRADHTREELDGKTVEQLNEILIDIGVDKQDMMLNGKTSIYGEREDR